MTAAAERYVDCEGNALTGTFTPVGMSDFVVTTLDITDVAAKLPGTAFLNRKSMSVLNNDTVETLYIGKSNVTADSVVGTTSGWPVFPSSTYNIDFSGAADIYARAPAGKTIRVTIIEYRD